MAQDILIVDDEADIRELVAGILEDEGYAARQAADGTSALNAIKFRQPSLVILDVWLGDNERDGIKILEIIKRDHPYVPVIMISGHSTIETAVAAIKRGAYDFLEKPFDAERLLLVVQRAVETAKLRRENAELKLKSGGVLDLIGNSQAIIQIRQQIEKAAPTNSRILINGPSGAGKEVVARKIHQLSRRANGPFVVLNCASLHPDRLEAELFGTEIMGLDPTVPRKIGLLEQAHGGILFLDEITDLPLPTQSKLIRVLQDQSFCRLGDHQKIEVDVRIIGATSTNILQAIKDGHFREDLYYRLNVVPIIIPSLQERVTDIPLLMQYFMQQAALTHGRPIRILSEEATIVLQSYEWPGNIRQLRNIIEWILIMAPGGAKDPVTVDMLPPEIRSDTSFNYLGSPSIVVMPLREAREAFEREYLLAQVNRFGGNISKTARFVGMERSALHRKLRALGVHEGRGHDEEPESATEVQIA
ncbi:sigma-54-dependent transcriptional regulator [Candidatus Paracaedibacter symbiosus]|uniref:nitrogen assimilation response regulator NtrX n=1 Tax=Candidatus Paracaedibacter symbiosus TaxID=244582 RepID=UPI00050979A4|nr:sigma-54 dependent transcriptional regulator [Candidatus Paracaedibacter symbiosus]